MSSNNERRIGLHPKSVNAAERLDQLGQWVMYYEVIKLGSKVRVQRMWTWWR